jgi:hypothetical protein
MLSQARRRRIASKCAAQAPTVSSTACANCASASPGCPCSGTRPSNWVAQLHRVYCQTRRDTEPRPDDQPRRSPLHSSPWRYRSRQILPYISSWLVPCALRIGPDHPGNPRSIRTCGASHLKRSADMRSYASAQKRAKIHVGPWSDAIPFGSVAGYAAPIRRAD